MTTKSKTVVVTDYEFSNLDPERLVIEAAGFKLVGAQARTEQDVLAACAEADGILNQYALMTATVIAALLNCQVISRYGIGLDTIDVAAATAAGIVVANVPDGSLDDVSDHAAAMILAFARGTVTYDRSMRGGKWDFAAAEPLRRLRGATLGLLGYGQIAQRLGVKLAGFGMRVIASETHAHKGVAAQRGVMLVDIETLYAESDFLSIHVPLTIETTGMVNAIAFDRMKPTAYLVNTARGPVVDQDALVDALRTRQIAGAGLDVFQTEPLAADHPLRSLDNVILSPHSAWYSEDSELEIRTKAARNVVEVLQGHRPTYHVNPDVQQRRQLD